MDIVYGSGRKSVLPQLDVIQARVLRICFGAVKAAPVCALQADTIEMPLWIQRTQLMANCWINFEGCDTSQPTHRGLGRLLGEEATKVKFWVGSGGQSRTNESSRNFHFVQLCCCLQDYTGCCRKPV